MKKPKKTQDIDPATHVAEQLVDLDEEVTLLRSNIASIKEEVETKRRQWMNETIAEGGRFFQAMQNAMLHDLFSFLKSAPLWEMVAVNNVGVCGVTHDMLKPYYAKGYRYLGIHYDPKTAERMGILLHRPKVPDTFEEFRTVYQDFLLGKFAEKETPDGEAPRPAKKVARKRGKKQKTRN